MSGLRPLYLQGSHGLAVRLDGPALRVLRPAHADQLFPLTRLSRVVLSGAGEWSTAALLACAEHGISVTFLDRDGGVRAYLFGDCGSRESLFHRLRDLLERPDWRGRYVDWCRGMESHARRALCRRIGLDPSRAHELALSRNLETIKRRYASAAVCRWVEQHLYGWLAALVAEELAAVGLDAPHLHSFGERLQPIADFTRLLAWDLQLPVIERLQHGAAAAGAVDERQLVQLFEARVPRLRRLARLLHTRLYNWLVELT